MNPPDTLSHSHQRTYRMIFQHPVSHNLGWHDVLALFRHLGQVEEESNGHFKVTRNGQVLVIPPAHTKDVSDTEGVMKLRHFLERSEPAGPATSGSDAPGPAGRWLLVINHHEARLFRSVADGAAPEHIRPPQADRESHAFSGLARGQEKPADHSFFAPIATALKAAGEILLFGSGQGTANEMDRFAAWLTVHHPETARRIIGTQIIDEHHLTDEQLLGQARDFQPGPAPALAP